MNIEPKHMKQSELLACVARLIDAQIQQNTGDIHSELGRLFKASYDQPEDLENILAILQEDIADLEFTESEEGQA